MKARCPHGLVWFRTCLECDGGRSPVGQCYACLFMLMLQGPDDRVCWCPRCRAFATNRLFRQVYEDTRIIRTAHP